MEVRIVTQEKGEGRGREDLQDPSRRLIRRGMFQFRGGEKRMRKEWYQVRRP